MQIFSRIIQRENCIQLKTQSGAFKIYEYDHAESQFNRKIILFYEIMITIPM